MNQIRVAIKFLTLFFIVLITNQAAKAQLNAADSVLFSQIFNHQKYVDDSAFPGNWFVNDSIQSVAELQGP